MQDSDDIRYMAGALKVLGVKLEERWEKVRMRCTACTAFCAVVLYRIN